MKKRYVNAFLLIFVILVIAFSSLYFGQKMMHKHQGYHGHYNAHQYLHDQLNITEEQERELSKLEAKYQKQKYVFERIRNTSKEVKVPKSRGALGTGFTYAPVLCFKPSVNRQPGFRRWDS